ncbi:ATP-binding cassette domain-containing protein [Pseudanabaena sp. UWO310]|uniref:ATP-binding cassette domain-containing protein n=1 Tax=Pseudanabaena sp. UWO310 TaxID=2480795 RepID=UPI0011611297|nr:ATP-binding cassette domain-containing protein [Pseudanabaena sp. UWO310]TYQ23954.1 ABC transporter ATP-binding protein [Pseudanabaena sp. UWO310]
MVSIYTQSNSIALSQEFPPIHIQGLYKHYGKTAAVRGIDLDINRGELFGLIGPDGAGKTTIFHILGGVMEATAGKVQILGQTPRKVRNAIGYLTQQFSLYLDLSVDENLRYSASLRQVSDRRFQQQRQKYLKLMQLDRFGDRLAGKLSGGMKQKLALCCALISEPKVLLLDEPTTGVDTVARREFWDILAGLTAQGITIIVATPDLDEAERCDRIALLYDGQIKQMGTPKQLKDALKLHRLEIYTSELAKADRLLLDVVEAYGGNTSSQIVDVQVLGDRIDVLVREPEMGEAEVRSLFAAAQIPDPTIRQSEPTLENVFVNLIRSQGAIPKFVVFPRQRQVEQITNPADAAIAIHARQLNRTFGNFRAVQNLNLEIRYGEVYGLLGANGAGKTTAIKMLCGLLPISSGEISLGGEKGNLRSADLRQRIGYMSQKFTLYDDLTIIENLEFYSGVYGIPPRQQRQKIAWVLEICGLEGQEKLMTGSLPGGWKQRVAFGASVMHEPEILFLDEPTSGVDVLARKQFWQLINDFARNGTAILVTTHYMNEAEQCNRMCFMVSGQKVAEGSASEIKAAQVGQLFEIAVTQVQDSYELLRTQFEPWRISIFGDRLHVVLDEPDREILQLRSLMQSANLEIHDMQIIPFSLEDAFIGEVQRAGGASP